MIDSKLRERTLTIDAPSWRNFIDVHYDEIIDMHRRIPNDVLVNGGLNAVLTHFLAKHHGKVMTEAIQYTTGDVEQTTIVEFETPQDCLMFVLQYSHSNKE